MKKHLLLGAALLSLMATSCSNDDVIDNGTEVVAGKTITLNAAINNGADTRMTYTDDGSSKMSATWSSKESFTMYKGTNGTGSTFTNSTDDTGKFKGDDIEGEGTYYAVYGDHITNTDGKLSIDLSGYQVGTNEENGIKEFMLASTETLSSSTTLNFDHKLTVLKMTLTLPSNVTGTIVSKVTVSGLHNKATYTLSSSSYAYDNNDMGDITVINGPTGFSIGSDHTTTAYVAVFPESVAANQVTISAEVGGCEYFYTISAQRDLVAGKVIPVNVNWAEAMSSNSGTLTVDAVKAALDNNNKNLVIESNTDLTNGDFAVLRQAFADYPDGSINLTLLNQQEIPVSDGFVQTGAFQNCKALKSVSAPNLTSTGQDCFRGCTSLSLVSLPKVEFVRIRTFYDCTSLTSISLPEATRLGAYSFDGCSSLTSLYLPKVTDIDCEEYTNDNAFTNCTRAVISVSVKDGTDWWKQFGGTDASNYGWASVNVIKTNLKSTFVMSDYYEWDAELSFADGGKASQILEAKHSCKDAPTLDQVKMYLGAGVYWDDGTEGDNQQTYQTPDGKTCHTGLWVVKKAYINGFSENTANKPNSVTPKSGRPTDINKYFFLPAAGCYSNPTSYAPSINYGGAGTYGWYWSSSSGTVVKWAYQLEISKKSAYVNWYYRDDGSLPMIAE